MVIASKLFNSYLLSLLVLSLVAGCQSPERKAGKRLTVLNIHIEARDLPGREERISISRDQPFTLSIQKSPFLTQNEIEQAAVVDVVGGFAIRLKLVHQGASLLEQYCSNNPGKHLAIFSQFVVPPDEKLNTG